MSEKQSRLLDLKAVELKTSLPKSTIYDWMKTGYFLLLCYLERAKEKLRDGLNLI